MEVEAGCILQTAQEAAAEAGLLLPISLAAEGSARIGGVISTNAGGTNVLRYGMARSRVLGLEVVTAEGEIVSGLRAAAQGQRRLRLEAVVHRHRRHAGHRHRSGAAARADAAPPRHRAAGRAQRRGCARSCCAPRARRIGDTLNAFELMSGAGHRPGRAAPAGCKAPLGAIALVRAARGQFGACRGLRDAVEALLGEVLEREEASDGVMAESERQEAELWALRESITEAEPREGRSVKHDVSVPISAIPAFLAAADAAVLQAFPGIAHQRLRPRWATATCTTTWSCRPAPTPPR